MDEMVLKTQQWLNSTYGGDSRYNIVDEDGATGWETIYGLTRAFQIELGISDTADAFGPTTKRLMNQQFPGGIIQQADGAAYESNVYGIIQGALWCKGYSTGSSEITRHFYGGTGYGIRSLKADMGVSNANSTVTIDIMEALLSMKQYVLVSGGKSIIRSIQQAINAAYQSYVGIIPCDGLYGREMNDALIKVLQAIEGFSPDEATGNFGQGTKSRCPVLPDSSEPEATRLLKYALCCNGYAVSELGSSWTTETTTKVKAFQTEYCLEADGIVGLNTWMALLLSCGNPDRTAKGCDCATVLNADKAKALYRAGYRYVGRYLTGAIGSGSSVVSKAMTKAELTAVFDAGLRVFAIYQDNDPVVSYYTEIQGEVDGVNAVRAARALGIPADSFIYFAVDCDMMDYQVTSNAIPYFRGIRKALRSADNLYRVGIYGSRNICTRVCQQNLAKSSFVADMSTGYSGNMGYPIPSNWAFDQFDEYVFTGASANFDLDKDAYSGRYSGFGKIADFPDNYEPVSSDDLLLDRAEFLLAKIGISISAGCEIGIPKEVLGAIPGVTVTYKISKKLNYENFDDNMGVINISNNQIASAQMTSIKGVYDNLDTNIQALVSEDGELSILNSFIKEIGNGRIGFDYSVTATKLTAKFIVEEKLWNNNNKTETLGLEISIEIKNDGTYNKEFTTLRQVVDAQSMSEKQSACYLTLSAIALATGIGLGVIGGIAGVSAMVKVLEGVALAVIV